MFVCFFFVVPSLGLPYHYVAPTLLIAYESIENVDLGNETLDMPSYHVDYQVIAAVPANTRAPPPLPPAHIQGGGLGWVIVPPKFLRGAAAAS